MSDLNHPKRHDDLFNFQLKRLVSLGGAPAVRLCEGRFGVSRFEWRLVAALVEDGPMAPSALARRTGMEPGRVSKSIAALTDKRLVGRRPDPADRRRATLTATEAGHALYRDLFPQLARLNQRLLEVLDEDEVQVLEECLRRLTEHARRIYLEGGGVDARADRRRGGSRRLWTARSRLAG